MRVESYFTFTLLKLFIRSYYQNRIQRSGTAVFPQNTLPDKLNNIFMSKLA